MEKPVDMSEFGNSHMANADYWDDEYDEEDENDEPEDSSQVLDGLDDIAIYDSTTGSVQNPSDLMVQDLQWHGFVTIRNPDKPTEFWLVRPDQALILFGFDTKLDFDPNAPGHFIKPVFDTLGPSKLGGKIRELNSEKFCFLR